MSYKYVVEISDAKGKSCKLLIEADSSNVGIIGGCSGSWRTLDKGFISYNSGTWSDFGYFTDSPRFSISLEGYPLPQAEKSNYILELTSFLRVIGVRGDDTNKVGQGYISQQAVLAIEPGKIAWALIESNEWW